MTKQIKLPTRPGTRSASRLTCTCIVAGVVFLIICHRIEPGLAQGERSIDGNLGLSHGGSNIEPVTIGPEEINRLMGGIEETSTITGRLNLRMFRDLLPTQPTTSTGPVFTTQIGIPTTDPRRPVIVVGQGQIDRINKCREAVNRVRPGLGEISRENSSYIDGWKKNCLHKLEDLDLTDVFSSEIGIDTPRLYETTIQVKKLVKNRIVGVTMPKETCTGLVITSRTLLTADHCLPKFPGFGGGMPKQVELAKIVVRGYREDGTVWEVKGVKVFADSFSIDTFFQPFSLMRNVRDWVILSPQSEIEQFPVGGKEITVKLEAPILTYDRLLLASYFKGDEMLVDDNPSCRVEEPRLDQGYFLHRCQTLPGSSGAPVLKISNTGELTVVGIHVGREHTVDGKSGDIYVNEAILIPKGTPLR